MDWEQCFSMDRDPFDRVLIAQARIERVPLMTSDKTFRSYAVELIDADGSTAVTSRSVGS
jgi:PIN domain nuclease of toxin-antitoxin system